jgi:hypothetical protein
MEPKTFISPNNSRKGIAFKLLFPLVASAFSEQIKDDMSAIKWNPFNTNEDEVERSNRVSFYKGMPVIRISGTASASFGALWLRNAAADLIRHEWGHSVQLMLLGMAAYAVIALLSIASSQSENHDKTPWERAIGWPNDFCDKMAEYTPLHA